MVSVGSHSLGFNLVSFVGWQSFIIVDSLEDDKGAQLTINNILLIDDHREMSDLIHDFLSSSKHLKLFYAEDVKAANEVLKNCFPDLFIVDIDMKDIDGRTFVRVIQELNRDANILFITAHKHLVDLEIEAPVLYKPFTREDLITEIGRF